MPIHPSLNNYTNSMANALAWYYAKQGKLRLVEGNQPIEDANGEILAAIGAQV